MNSSNFNQFNSLFQTSIKVDYSVKFGMVRHGDVEDILFNPTSGWEFYEISARQFFFHEYAHILHNRLAHMQYGGWLIKEDRWGKKAVNRQLYRWFIEQDFDEHRNEINPRYDQYFKDYREWWAETFCIFLHKVMGWPLREDQEVFYALCIEKQLPSCPCWRVLWDAVEVTALKLKEKG